MVKAWLRNDPARYMPPGDGLVASVAVALEDDCCGPLPGSNPIGGGDGDPDTPVVDNPSQHVIIRSRTRVGFDEDGNPMFEWATVIDGLAWFKSERSEFDHIAGMTLVKATAMVEYGGPERVFETAVLNRVSDNTLWRVVGVEQPYGRVELDLRQIDQQADGVQEAP